MTLAARTADARLINRYDMDDIAAGYLTLWLSAQSPTFYQLDGSSQVEAAFDLSSRGQNATQATSSLRPFIASQGGVDWFDFSQGNDYLTTVSGETTRANGGTVYVTGARTVLAVVYLNYGTHTNNRRAICETYTDYYHGSVEINTSNQLAASMNDGVVDTVTSSTTFPLQSVQVVAQRFEDGGLHTLWRDGTQRASSSIGEPNDGNMTGWRIGTYRDANDRFYNGLLGELVVIDRNLSDTELVAATEVLMQRWS